ncbi:MAG: hypothetical protein HYT22_03120 [Candidatus Niyogibacteria bacterium]|nr:hypothetical protein [Candidatus Niyogibacteria bacterium]
MKIQLFHIFEDIIEIENLLEAWKEFVRGKRAKADVLAFSLQLMDNLSELNGDLSNHIYHHGPYQAFSVHDPKPRSIHKAFVRDRLLHHAVHRILYPFFDRTFVADSYSCRVGKGTHKAIKRFREFGNKVGKNNTRTCWVLKCDIKKFFASVDQKILYAILAKYISDENILALLQEIIESFYNIVPSRGLPLGNLTSQLFANVYMNEFDQFAKHKLKTNYYIRYADDFVIFSANRDWLRGLIPQIGEFLSNQLKLELHPDKLFIKTLASGVDFLGWVHFPDHRVLRTTTKKRMMKRIVEHPTPETLTSYVGLLRHGNARKLKSLLLKTNEF